MPGFSNLPNLLRDTSFIESQLKLPTFHSKIIKKTQQIVIVDETTQETGSFKVRGALYAVNQVRLENNLDETHVIVASSGNFGIGIAFACKKFGIPCTIYLPKYTSIRKIQKLEELGANIKNEFKSYETAKASAIFDSSVKGSIFKFIDGASIETFIGNMSLIKQIDREFNLNALDCIVVPFGIGSLYIPILVYGKLLRKNFKVIAVEPKLANKYQRSKRIIKIPKFLTRRTIASGADVSELPKISFEILDQFEPKVFSTPDKLIRKAMGILEKDYRIQSEAAGSLAFAYSLTKRNDTCFQRIFYIVTGGNN
jgi:threonine dehydratase